ncbi:MAG: hypothetical protein FWG55_03750 [Candidatus Bathyarchaeota archaeon]|nr:hypothetical protein [Candidatus Termiticorpusculum sp.]
MEHSTEKFENETSVACMSELFVDMDAESFYKFNWRLYIDDEFRASFYENPKKALEQASLNNITPHGNLKKIEPLTSEEHEILQLLNNPAYKPMRAEEFSYVQITGVKPAIELFILVTPIVVVIGAPADIATQLPEILRKKE